MKKRVKIALVVLVLGIGLVVFTKNSLSTFIGDFSYDILGFNNNTVTTKTEVKTDKDIKVKNVVKPIDNVQNTNTYKKENITNKDNYEYYEEYNFDDVKKLDLKMLAVDFVYNTEDVKNYNVKIYANKLYEKALVPKVKFENNELEIEQNINLKSKKIKEKIKVIITAPKKRLDKVDMEVYAGNIEIKGLQANQVDLESSAINIDLEDNNISILNMETSAANTKIKNSKIKDLDLEGAAAQLILENTTIDRSEIDLSATNFEVQDSILKNANIDINAGSTTMNNVSFEGKNYISSNVGRVKINLSKNNIANIIKSKKDIQNYRDFLYLHNSFGKIIID